MYVLPFTMGPLGSRSPHRRAADRLRLCRRLDADHDPDGQARARRPGRTAFRPLRPLRRRRRSRRGERDCPGRRTPRRSTSSTSPRNARSGRLAPAMAATRCWARSALRCGSLRHGARRGLAGRAHADPGLTPRRMSKYIAAPSRACGKTNLAMMIPPLSGLEDHHRGRRHRLDQVRTRAGSGRSTRKMASSGSPPAPASDQPQRDGHDQEERDLHQLRAGRRRRRLVGGDDRRSALHAIDWHGDDWTPESEAPAGDLFV